jgi:hypothetical protein
VTQEQQQIRYIKFPSGVENDVIEIDRVKDPRSDELPWLIQLIADKTPEWVKTTAAYIVPGYVLFICIMMAWILLGAAAELDRVGAAVIANIASHVQSAAQSIAACRIHVTTTTSHGTVIHDYCLHLGIGR